MLKAAKYVLPFLIAGFAWQANAADYPSGPMDFVAPSGAGGGWDTTIRTVAKVLTDTKLVTVPMPVTNRVGGGGAVQLANMQKKPKADNNITIYSPPLLLINLTGTTPLSYKDIKPIANLISDYGAFAVRSDSPYKTIKDVTEALKKNPDSVKFGGNSSAGSLDHISFLLIAKAGGVPGLKNLKYISYQDGSGLAQLLGGHVDMLTTGMTEVMGPLKGGEIRVLCYTAPKPVPGREGIPTCREAGIDADVPNWRGLFGPKEMPEHAVKYWREKLGAMVKTKEWAAACDQFGWDDAYLDAPEFAKFLDQTNEDYKIILKELGMLVTK